MAKRRLIDLLPAWQQTDELKNFFGTTVDEVFQPGISDSISGYIGEKPSFFNAATDFYISEPSASRVTYQLEAGMVSIDKNNAITNALTYPDLINGLKTSGANTSDDQRLFENEYYSWAPPINIDMLTNYRQYYWFGDDTGSADLPTLVLAVPMNFYTGDGTTTTFALPASINAVDVSDELPSVFVNNLPVSATQSGNDMICAVAPAINDVVLVCRVPSLAAAILNTTSPVDISDINTEGALLLTSTMRIQIIDPQVIIGGWDATPWDINLWDFSGSGIYMVDGIGQSLRLTPDEYMIRETHGQYVTIDRSSTTANLWSYHNSWVHKDSYAWSGLQFPERQAQRPIIEFIRDLVLYPTQTWEAGSDPLFMLYDVENIALDDSITYPSSNFAGNKIFGLAVGSSPLDLVLNRQLSYDSAGYILFNNYAYSTVYTNAGSDITSLYCYGLDDGVTVQYMSLWHKSATTTIQLPSPLVFPDEVFYEIPKNLQANPSSDDVTTISRSTWLTHFESIIANQTNFVGLPLSDNNYRDSPRNLSLGTEILQHTAPLLKTMLLVADNDLNIPQAIRFAEQEYNKFRNKFLRKLVDIEEKGVLAGVDPLSDPTTWMQKALFEITRDKSVQFPFALSLMGGGKYFIPETPAYLGVLPPTPPGYITDDTIYSSPQTLLQGHDGSLTPLFNDYRDNVLLTLENLIYDNIAAEFKTEARPLFDIKKYVGGAFYDATGNNGYSFTEFQEIVGPIFELWVQANKLDYRTNPSYDENDPFTWNYKDVNDIYGRALPGNWRAIYRYYYGTDAPHIRPWEMLGFESEPSWWVTQYGAAPYTKSNTPLWDDLEQGIIRGGPRIGNDPIYARPGLSNLIPVNNSGILLNPVEIGIVTVGVPISVSSRSWQVGDQSPVENLWMATPSYRFGVALAAFLMKPVRFVELCWDTNIGYVGTQWVNINSNLPYFLARPLNKYQYVHGETRPDTSIANIIGIQQWIVDYLASSGKTSAVLGNTIRGLNVRLLHQMAGFVSSDEIKVVADNFGLLPSEDVNVILYTSPSSDVEVYSGVILQWTGTGWRVIGYDARNPWFTVIPPDQNSAKGLISLATAAEPSIVTWRSNTYFPANILAEYNGSVYEAIRSHTSGSTFEVSFWKARPDLSTSMIRAPRVTTYSRGLKTTQIVPYGTEFRSYQDVADFLLGWQRYLVSRGWVFDGTNQDSIVLNWELAVREFLVWAQIQWEPGNFIALSPGQTGLKFITPTGLILNVEDNITGFFGLLDRSGAPIKDKDALINRLDGEITLSSLNADIYAARLEIAEIEHLLIFDNVTVFNDNIYLPLFNTKQDRLFLICNRGANWAGRLDAPGFMIINNTMKSNFEKSANDVVLMFDIELADNKKLRDYARHVIGFQERDYLNNLFLSDVEQFEFYQGMIQQKGAPGVFSKLMRSQTASSNSNIEFLEEWAFRSQNRFGAPTDPFVTFQIKQLDTRTDPQIIRFVSTPNSPLTWINMPLTDPKWFDKPSDANFFTTRTTPDILPSAGPVRLSDVNYSAFHLTDITQLYQQDVADGVVPIKTGSKIWVYEREDGTYTVLESFETGSTPNSILQVVTKAEDISVTTSRIFFQNAMTITANDVGNYLVIDGQTRSDPELQGFEVITAVNVGLNYVDVSAIGISGFDFTSSLTDAPVVRILREVRFANDADLFASTSAYNVNDLAWIDNHNSTSRWAVLQWDGSAWNVARNQPNRIDPTNISETVIYNENVKIVDKKLFVNDIVVPDVDIIDPLVGLISGSAERELDFRTPYDPASYDIEAWGDDQIGRVWWDVSKVKFLDCYTDTINITNSRDLAELSYRLQNWGTIAPNSQVNIYEWTRNTVAPKDYAGVGIPYNITDSTGTVEYFWIEKVEYDPLVQKNKIWFYYWVSGLTSKPDVEFRKLAISDITSEIVNPVGSGTAWLAPIERNTLIISNVLPYLNDQDTVLKIRLTKDIDNQNRHQQWLLLRPLDETTLPDNITWDIFRNSLGAFTIKLLPLPYPSLAPTRNTGISTGQNMFLIDSPDGPRTGLMNARHSFVQSVNNIFSETAINIERQIYIDTIFRTSTINQYLNWTQIDDSYPYEAPPSNEWDVLVNTLEQRNKLVARQDFIDAVTNVTTIRVLLEHIGNPEGTRTWSIWNFDPVAAAAVIAAYPLLDPSIALLTHVDDPAISPPIFNLALSYEHQVNSHADRDLLLLSWGPNAFMHIGERVLVGDPNDITIGDETASMFWVVWKYDPSNINADAKGFYVWRVQRYRTSDFINDVDWYASGYSADNPPIIEYATIAERNAAETTSFANTFVKIADDGTGHWIWTVLKEVLAFGSSIAIPEVDFHNGANPDIIPVWEIVAREAGTIELDKRFYDDATRPVHGVTTNLITDITNRDGSWEIFILSHALRFSGLLLELEINRIWFDIVNFIHVQQADIDWIFKTSFMSIRGYNVPLQATPFVVPDQTDNLIGYIDEVKPYRVKIREFSTQFTTEVDDANVTVTDFDNPAFFDTILNAYRPLSLTNTNDLDTFGTLPWSYWYNNYLTNPNLIRGLDINLTFDRYVSQLEAWDTYPWDTVDWDDNEDLLNDVYVHTTINATLASPSTTISVDDVRFLRPSYVEFPITMNLGTHTYHITGFIQDTKNISTTLHGVSGKITTSTNVTVNDATFGNIVEAILPTPTAAQRIIQYYEPDATMPPNDLILLMDMDRPSSKIIYVTSIDAAEGDFTLTFTATVLDFVDQRIKGPNIIEGTVITDVATTVVTFDKALIGDVPAGTEITFFLPNWIDGYQLANLSSPSDFDTVGFDSAGLDVFVSNFSDVVYDGGDFANTPAGLDINPGLTANTPGSFPGLNITGQDHVVDTFREPEFGPNHPQERLPFAADDGVQITVTANADAGGPPQVIKEYYVGDPLSYPGPSATLSYDLVSQGEEGLIVYKDGVRAKLGTDYTVDHFARSVIYSNISGIEFIQIHAFGFGGTSAIDEDHFIAYSTNPIVLDNASTLSDVMVVQDGVLLNSSQYSVSSENVTLNTPPSAGTDMAVLVWNGGTSTATTMTTQTLAYNMAQQWTLTPNDTYTIPEAAGTIVEVNGQRLAPDPTFYGSFTADKPWMFLPTSVDNTTGIAVYVDRVLYTDPIPFCNATNLLSTYPFFMDGGTFVIPPANGIQFVIFNNSLLVALDPTFASSNVIVALDYPASPPDYTVSGGVLTINTPLLNTDFIQATTFSNSDSMELQTIVYDVGSVSEYFVPLPFAKDYAIVNMNGLGIAPDFDYEIIDGAVGWDSINWDDVPFDLSFETGILEIFNPTAGKIIATITTHSAAREEIQWKVFNRGPAHDRMPLVKDEDGNQVLVTVNSVTYQAHDIMFEYLRQSPYMAGVLTAPLASTDNTLVLSLFIKELAPKLQNPFPIAEPKPQVPGVIWINGERIEYFGFDRSADIVTLTELRRATRGTSIQEQRLVTSGTGTGSSQLFILDATNGTGEIEVKIDGVPSVPDSFSIVGSNLHINVTATNGSFVTVAMSIGFTYYAGTNVYNGTEDLISAVPVGIQAGNREISPIHEIIVR